MLLQRRHHHCIIVLLYIFNLANINGKCKIFPDQTNIAMMNSTSATLSSGGSFSKLGISPFIRICKNSAAFTDLSHLIRSLYHLFIYLLYGILECRIQIESRSTALNILIEPAQTNTVTKHHLKRNLAWTMCWCVPFWKLSMYSCTRKFGHPFAAATLLAISPDVYNVASCQLLLR